MEVEVVFEAKVRIYPFYLNVLKFKLPQCIVVGEKYITIYVKSN